MRLLFTGNSKTKVVRDGHSFVDDCPDCGKRATFTEVETREGYGVFWVDVVSDTSRGYRCGHCGEVFDLKDTDDKPASAPPPVKSAAELARERAAAEEAVRVRAAADRARAEIKANRIEDELADLKRRAGK